MTVTLQPPRDHGNDSTGIPALEVARLSVATTGGHPIVTDVCFRLHPGEVLGLIGESGSGKTTTALALLGVANPGTTITGGKVLVNGMSLLGRPDAETRRMRSRLAGYVPQHPGRSLNPARRIGRQLDEILRIHMPARDRERAIAQALERAQLPTDRRFRRRFPHQLSGGQQQRVTIAQALLLEPALIVLDEPTTGLDALTQHEILGHVDRLRRDTGVAMVYVTHDVAAIAALADQVAVLYAGSIVEHGPASAVLVHPRHPYTRGLIEAVPDPRAPRPLTGIPGTAAAVGARPPGCHFAPRCHHQHDDCLTVPPDLDLPADGHRVRCRHPVDRVRLILPESAPPCPRKPATALLQIRELTATHHTRHGRVVAADRVDLDLTAGSCVALIGGSGSGKTTIGRCIAGLHHPDAGTITLDTAALAGSARRRTPEQRRLIQMVYQNPGDALNPRRTVGAEIARVLRFIDIGPCHEIPGRVAELLECVRLPRVLAGSYPGELSGGEQQRVAIARALAANPSVLVCDEITSALDVSVQAAIVNLLGQLQRDLALTLLFISHDLGLVTSIADQVIVLEGGRLRVSGPTRDVVRRSGDPYTRSLLAAARSMPSISPTQNQEGRSR